jgi:hypothetical protein
LEHIKFYFSITSGWDVPVIQVTTNFGGMWATAGFGRNSGILANNLSSQIQPSTVGTGNNDEGHDLFQLGFNFHCISSAGSGNMIFSNFAELIHRHTLRLIPPPLLLLLKRTPARAPLKMRSRPLILKELNSLGFRVLTCPPFQRSSGWC